MDETEDLLCLWRAEFDSDLCAVRYGMDLFERRGRLWQRSGEEHIEYAHESDRLRAELQRWGFTDIRLITDCPQGDAGRLFIAAQRQEDQHG